MDNAPEQEPRSSADALSDVLAGAIRSVVTAIVVAGAIVGLAIYSRPGPPRFQAVVLGDQVVRLDTRAGSMIACDAQSCVRFVRRGQPLESRPEPEALPKPAAPTPPATQQPPAAPQP